MGEAVDVDSAVYCWRGRGVFWRMRASLGLACAQTATLCTQVAGRPRPRPRAARALLVAESEDGRLPECERTMVCIKRPRCDTNEGCDVEVTVTSSEELHAQAERAKKTERDEQAAASGGAEEDPEPEDGAYSPP